MFPAAVRQLTDLAQRGSDRIHGAGASAGLILVAIPALVLFQSVFWAEHVPWLLKIGIAAVAAVSVASPPNGLLVVAGLSPLGYMLTTRVSGAYPARITEAIALAFVAGYVVWSLRARFGRRETPSTPAGWSRLSVPVLLFGAAAVASCVVHYHFVQVWQDRPGPFFERLLEFLVRGYHYDLGNYEPTASNAGFRFVFMTAFALEGAALFLAAYLFSARDKAFAPRLVRMTVAGAAGAAALSFYAFAAAALREADPGGAVPELLARRWTMFTPKLNSAASLLVLAGPLAIGAAAGSSGWRRAAWIAATAVLAGALWINGTRVALLAALLVLGGTIVWWTRGRVRWRALGYPVIVGFLILGAGLAATTYQRFVVDQDLARSSLRFRILFTRTAVNMFASAPAFGVGIDQYYLQSERFAPEELFPDFPRVSAHNPFLQTAAELGLAGLVPFAWLIGAALWTGLVALYRRSSDRLLFGMLAGLTAFLITCVSSGHPLLIEVTAYPFWIVLGLAAGCAVREPADPRADPRAPAVTDPPWTRACAVLGILLLACSIPPRVVQQSRGIDFAAVTYGLHDIEDNGIDRYRWTTGHGTLFIPADAGDIELPLRAPLIDRTGPMQVEIHLDGRLANRLELRDPNWHRVRMEIPPSGPRYRALELLVDPTWVPADLLPGSEDVRELGIMVGAVVNGPPGSPPGP